MQVMVPLPLVQVYSLNNPQNSKMSASPLGKHIAQELVHTPSILHGALVGDDSLWPGRTFAHGPGAAL
jgi:hypothetical protein